MCRRDAPFDGWESREDEEMLSREDVEMSRLEEMGMIFRTLVSALA